MLEKIESAPFESYDLRSTTSGAIQQGVPTKLFLAAKGESDSSSSCDFLSVDFEVLLTLEVEE